jgi:uncharacterized membrane protein YcaP (DUF421 family)
MDFLFGSEWKEVFSLDLSLLEIVVRGSLIYLGLLLILRLIAKREAGTMGIADLLAVVLIADAASGGLTGDSTSLLDGILLGGTVIFWSHTLDRLAYHYKPIHKLLHPETRILVKNGRMIHRNLRRELITEDELMGNLREKGISDLGQVKEAYIEGEGNISVIPYQRDETTNQSKRKKPAVGPKG